jgi:hypothetical protein
VTVYRAAISSTVLPLDQWQLSQVFAIHEEQIEREEHTFPAAEQ